MPFIGIGLSTIIAIVFAIHAIRSGQTYYWLFILFAFPFLGSIVYCVAIFIPSLRHTSTAYHLESTLRKTLNPGKELKEAQDAYEISPTIDANTRLAKALVDNGRASQSLSYYEDALSGIYQDAPDILLQYAYALYLTKNYLQAKAALDKLRAKNPNYRSDDGHLLYAKILVALDDKVAAKEEFDALINYYPSFEALAQYLAVLIEWHEYDEAKAQLGDYAIRLKHMPKHSKRLNAKWIKEIENLKKSLT